MRRDALIYKHYKYLAYRINLISFLSAKRKEPLKVTGGVIIGQVLFFRFILRSGMLNLIAWTQMLKEIAN